MINFKLKNRPNPYLILEAGINHEGLIDKAIKIIDLSKQTKANAIKFQYFDPEDIYLSGSEGFKSLKKCFLSREEIYSLKKNCGSKIEFLCTGYSKKSFNFLEKIKVKAHKISSMDNNNTNLINYVAKFNKPIFFSTGMSDIANIKKQFRNIFSLNKKLVILHCISNYPTLNKDLNLNTINFLKKKFNCKIGFSDHSIGIYALLAVLSFYPDVIEKHFTFDKKRLGFDHNISADFKDIKFFYEYLEFYKNCFGATNVFKNRPDSNNEKVFRKGLYYRKGFFKGEIVNEESFLQARPGKNFSMINIIEKNKEFTLKKNVKGKQLVNFKDFK
jgi:sialic acid synthase SpsE